MDTSTIETEGLSALLCSESQTGHGLLDQRIMAAQPFTSRERYVQILRVPTSARVIWHRMCRGEPKAGRHFNAQLDAVPLAPGARVRAAEAARAAFLTVYCYVQAHCEIHV